ncbi:helix-turn-helix domain-containing protein [Aquabacterium sp. A7-Y]|uniref:helix-turn-helix domain-containing protein n=1 Tax=Aquabacterium sp. A7-Y TaxID=1349605 RepID=UPI00223CC2B3|nr:helix-turn-helix domain-containing protein [Aquabacterium sp. A7-Y]MCW7540476.1 helix-turn-helix domain-containing protein [Aquabacterium sp. A7-Y]
MRNPEVRQQIGQRLLEERARLGLTQQALADAIGAPRVSFVKYESGQSSPAAETLAALEVAGVDVRYVLTGFRTAPSGVDRDRFRQAFLEVERQVKTNKERLSTDDRLSLAWRIYDALSQVRPSRQAQPSSR